jgi:hypothetical protein
MRCAHEVEPRCRRRLCPPPQIRRRTLTRPAATRRAWRGLLRRSTPSRPSISSRGGPPPSSARRNAAPSLGGASLAALISARRAAGLRIARDVSTARAAPSFSGGRRPEGGAQARWPIRPVRRLNLRARRPRDAPVFGNVPQDWRHRVATRSDPAPSGQCDPSLRTLLFRDGQSMISMPTAAASSPAALMTSGHGIRTPRS